jgi:hypothetical protein
MRTRGAFADPGTTGKVTVLKSVLVSWPSNGSQVSAPALTLAYQEVDYPSPASVLITAETAGSATEFYRVVLVLFIIWGVLAVLLFLYRFWTHVKYNPEIGGELYYCFKSVGAALSLLLETMTFMFGLFLIVATGYWFFFYKFQSGLFVLLPSRDSIQDYVPYNGVFFFSFAAGLVSYLLVLYRIASVELYFMDWERAVDDKQQAVAPQSFWRAVHCAKKLRALILHRRSSTSFNLLVLLFFLAGLSWEDLSLEVAYPFTGVLVPAEKPVFNPVLLHFLVWGVYLLTAWLTWVARWMLGVWWPLPEEQLQDLLSMGNLSLWIFDHTLHGYYLHGQHPLGRAEGPIRHHAEVLEKETRASVGRAFLMEDSCQAFELLLPLQMRHYYNTILANKIREKVMRPGQGDQLLPSAVPTQIEDYRQLDLQKEAVNRLLKLFLEEVKKDHVHRVTYASLLERVTGCLPSIEDIGQLPLLIRDHPGCLARSFSRGYEI